MLVSLLLALAISFSASLMKNEIALNGVQFGSYGLEPSFRSDADEVGQSINHMPGYRARIGLVRRN